MITWKDAEARIAAGGTITKEELRQIVTGGRGRTAEESERLFNACPEWVAEQEGRRLEINEKEQRYLKEEEPLRAELFRLGYPVKWVWDFVNSDDNYYVDAIPVLIEHLRMSYSDDIREGIARSLAVKEARGQAGPAIVSVLQERDLSDQLRWALANTLAIVADHSVKNAIESLLEVEVNEGVASLLRKSLKVSLKS